MELIEAFDLAQKGDQAGFDYLYRYTKDKAYYCALSKMKNPDDAYDVLHDAYIKVFNNIKNIDVPQAFVTYLNKAIANKALDIFRQRQTRNTTLFSEYGNDDDSDNSKDISEIEDTSDYANVEINIEHEERKKLIDELMSDLSDDQKLCVTAFYIQEMSIKDIAEAYETSENTIKSRLFQARKKIETKGNEMKKRGIEFFGLSIVAFLASLTSMEAKACEYMGPEFSTIMSSVSTAANIGTTSAATSSAIKSGITIAGKTISTKVAAIIGAAVIAIGGIGTAVIINTSAKDLYQRIYIDFDRDSTYIEYVFDYQDGINDKYCIYYNDNDSNTSYHGFASYTTPGTKIYATKYHGNIYFTTQPNSNGLYCVWNSWCKPNVEYDSLYMNGITQGYVMEDGTPLEETDPTCNELAQYLYDTNFDYSLWTDITTLGTKGLSQKDAYNYSVEHQDEWIELIATTNDDILNTDIESSNDDLNTDAINNDVTNNNTENDETTDDDSSDDTENIENTNETALTGTWTNDFPGASEGIDHFEINFDNMTYYAGDANGIITYIGNNQYQFTLTGFSDGSTTSMDEGIVTITQNDDGTISASYWGGDVMKKVGTFSW